MTDLLIPINQPEAEPEYNFDTPEDVMIEVVQSNLDARGGPQWSDYSIESCTILNPSSGAASYEQAEVGFLDYTCEGLIDCQGEGWFVIEGVTAVYHKGDGWMSDDDMRFNCSGFRPATAEERKMA